MENKQFREMFEDRALVVADVPAGTARDLAAAANPSQMREAIAWALFARANVPAARHTYARVAINDGYQGLYSLIEQVDKGFLRERFGANGHGNLYKAYCGDVGFRNSAPFTGRQFTNDEVYRAGHEQFELRHANEFVLGIYQYARMRYDGAREQLAALRDRYPAGASGAQF
jgi:hypothetical protein